MTPTEGDIIRAERARSELYATDQAHITAAYCNQCGVRLDGRGHCPTGCLDNQTAAAIIDAQPKNKHLLTWVREKCSDKNQWYSGESLWIMPKKYFLKASAGWVRLHIVGGGRSLPVYVCSPLIGWVEVVGLDREFAKWLKE
jgi:hypothetical protein